MADSDPRQQLRDQALDWSGDDPTPSIAAIQELTRLGDFTILPELQQREANLVWDGPVADGMENMAYIFQIYHEAVDAMAKRASDA